MRAAAAQLAQLGELVLGLDASATTIRSISSASETSAATTARSSEPRVRSLTNARSSFTASRGSERK